jgi:osmotically-inducible protein OsmY
MRLTFPLFTLSTACFFVGCGEDLAKKPTTPASSNPTTSNSATATPAPASTTTQVAPAADNSAKNTRDDGTTLTPVDQGTSSADTTITAEIRKAVVAEPNLSTKAQNAKIITKNGVVTLRGPVETATERTKIMTIAEQVPGVARVDNQLEIVTQ